MSNMWELVWGKQQVDPESLALAIERELLETTEPDFRTRLLIRDATSALKRYWGNQPFEQWLKRSRVGDRIKSIRKEDLGETGFHFLKDQLMESTKAKVVMAFLRELGSSLGEPVVLNVGGSIALILSGQLDRATDDIDVVDEVPETIRARRELLNQLQQRYHLMVTHFQSHYLPSGWHERLHPLGSFGSLQVYIVDAYDVFVGKLFSKRNKDLDDLRALESKLDKQKIVERVEHTTADLRKDAALTEAAARNWYIVFGEPLPAGPHPR
jgi:hypothetical protein